jgi:hypothetical protein
MILILEDDADREAYRRGAVELNHRNTPEEAWYPDLRPTTVWISTEAYEEKARADEVERRFGWVSREDARAWFLADLRAKVEVLGPPQSSWSSPNAGEGWLDAIQAVLDLFDGEQR